MPKSLLHLLIWLTALAVCACGAKTTASSRTQIIGEDPKDGDQASSRRASFSADDISKIKLLPAEGNFEPWNQKALSVVGTFPDGSEAIVSEGLVWSIDTEDNAEIVFDSGTGAIASSTVGSYKLTAKWAKDGGEKLTATANVNFKYIDGSAFKVIPNPGNFEAMQTASGKVMLTWLQTTEYLSGYAMAYAMGATPPTCLESELDPEMPTIAGVTYVLPAAISKDKQHYEASGLVPNGLYSFRLCAVQTIELGGKKIERESSGALTVLRLTMPGPTPTP